MDNKRSIKKEQYKKGNDVINYVVYKSTTGVGNDEVLQHKLLGKAETSHITLHHNGTVNFRVKRNKEYLENAVRRNLTGYSPSLSHSVKSFISKIRGKI